MAIIGAILGDIGGSRWEFCKPKAKRFRLGTYRLIYR